MVPVMRFLLFLCLLVFPVAAFAQDNAAFENLCAHVSSKDEKPENGAKYVPGVDTEGNPVVPADLSGNINAFLNNPIVLPIDVNLALRYGLSLPAGVELEPNIANMLLYQDGRILYGNVDVSESVKSYCESRGKEIQKNQSNQAEEHGHESANPVLSSDKIEGQYPEDEPRRH